MTSGPDGGGDAAVGNGSTTGSPDPPGTAHGGRLDVVVLAGGTGRRLGGASKPDVVARGARLLDHVLAGLSGLADLAGPASGAEPTERAAPENRGPAAATAAAAARVGRVVVVAPAEVALPAGVLRALEDPPLGGPVAGIAAGLARLAESSGSSGSPGSPGRAAPAAHAARAAAPAELTAVVTCDAPESGRGLPALVAAAGSAQNADGACALDGDHVQYLLGVYRTAALTQCVAPGGAALRDISVRRALGGLSVVHVDLGELRSAARDLDTWEDVRAWDRH
ncbi:NTP transferase domain-containing protein [Actinomyces massiliensis]|uniref:molybdenum cofactor guanylyltransferase n=1 Tax=Actinomyces massiliensis TaxID=461393 RepID=UPI0028EBA53B|nr:NTP transferase domain-containing protein [Actinomyces massiliensis]